MHKYSIRRNNGTEDADHDTRRSPIDPELVSSMKQLILAHSLRVRVIDHTISGKTVDHTIQHLHRIRMQDYKMSESLSSPTNSTIPVPAQAHLVPPY